MEVIVKKNYEEMSKVAATLFAAEIMENPKTILGMATGSTPVGLYKELVKMYEAGDLDFSQVTTFNLDEYIGLAPEHDQSYHYFMHDHFFDHVNIDPSRINLPNGMEPDEKKECARYDAVLRSVGDVDIQLLGIGRNGHIGFNEPDDHFTCGCHVVNLTESTIQANRRFFDSEASVPRQAVSLGVGSILASRCILLLATGEDKAQAIHDTVCGDITSRTPASILKTHPNVILLLDRAAAGML